MCCPSSGWSKIALIVLVIGIILHLTGWATLNWMTGEKDGKDYEVGLWRMTSCETDTATNTETCTEETLDDGFATDEYNAIRALETIALCLAGFAAVILIIYMCADGVRKPSVAGIIMGVCYLAGTCSFVGMIIHLTTTPSGLDISWSLGLTVIAMTLILIAGTLMIPDTFDAYDDDVDDPDRDDFYNPRGRSPSSPNGPKRRPPSRSVTPISYRGGVEGSRWRSY